MRLLGRGRILGRKLEQNEEAEDMWRERGQNQLGRLLVESRVKPGLGAGGDRVVSRARQLEDFSG